MNIKAYLCLGLALLAALPTPTNAMQPHVAHAEPVANPRVLELRGLLQTLKTRESLRGWGLTLSAETEMASLAALDPAEQERTLNEITGQLDGVRARLDEADLFDRPEGKLLQAAAYEDWQTFNALAARASAEKLNLKSPLDGTTPLLQALKGLATIANAPLSSGDGMKRRDEQDQRTQKQINPAIDAILAFIKNDQVDRTATDNQGRGVADYLKDLPADIRRQFSELSNR